MLIGAVSTEMFLLIVFSRHLDSVFSTKMHFLCDLEKDISLNCCHIQADCKLSIHFHELYCE